MAFNVMDLDNSGTVSIQEIREQFSSTNFNGSAELNVDEGFWAQLISHLDSDGDGEITFEEFAREMNSMLLSSARNVADQRSNLSKSLPQQQAKNGSLAMNSDEHATEAAGVNSSASEH